MNRPIVSATMAFSLLFAAHLANAAGDALSPVAILRPQPSASTEADEATKVSGAACTTDQETCLLVGDEYRYALTFEIAGDNLVLKDRVFLVTKKDKNGKKIKEADTEGISFSDGIFYLVGSHGRNKEGNKGDPRYFAYRVPATALKGGDLGSEDDISHSVEVSSRLEEILKQKKALKDANKLAPEKGGTNIEGIAVLGDKFFVGFRGPLLDGEAVIGEASVKEIFDGAPGDFELHPVDLGKGQAVRDLAAYKNDVLILAGPQDRDGGKAAVYKWTPGGEAVKLAELDPAGSPDRQPETLMVLETSEDAVRCLVFDDGDKSANPRIYEIPVTP
ncbi:DUF3616 domain-containing protein (plasmid) [Sinorhizobium sp. B11]